MANLSDLITSTSSQELMVQSLKDAGFEGDLTPGSPVYQLLIDPNAVIYAVNVAKQDEIKNAWSLMSGQLNTEAGVNIEAVSNIFNNLRISPASGGVSSGKVALVFSSNSARSIAGATFISQGGHMFTTKLPYTIVPSESRRSSYNSSELLYSVDRDGYSVEIEVVAVEMGPRIVGSGDVLTATVPGLISAHASSSFSGGYSTESIEDLIRDVPDTLSETSMVSPVSLVANVKGSFPQVNEISVFRPGDKEMQRSNKNFLGVDSGSADIVLTTSAKPSVSRTTIPGHIELTIDEDGVFWNSSHRLGYAYRQPSVTDLEEGVDSLDILNGYVFIEGQQTDSAFTGASSVIAAGIETYLTPKTTKAAPDSEAQDYVTILSRRLVQDDRYGALPVEGSDEKDFYFSAYQHRLTFEFRTDWLEVEDTVEGVYDKVYAWSKYWTVYHQNEILGDGGDAFYDELNELADSFGLTPSEMPTTYRPEVPIYADLVYYASLADIQTHINDSSRRCFGQDYLVKAPHTHAVSMSITVSREVNFLRFREEYFKTKIADFISSRGLTHTSPITTEHIKSLIFEEGSNTANREFTLLATTTTRRHSGEFSSFTGDHVDYLDDSDNGVTPRNSVLVCSSENIEITYL